MLSVRAVAGRIPDTVVPSTVALAALELIRRAVTWYPVITDPPVLAGGFQFAVAVITPPLPPLLALRMTGAPGTVAGVTGLESPENNPVPMALVACTWNR